ncbi:MAG: DNA alkylation repair protein [Christensenellaceae bacterium]|jgi:3-methyladenine DNA glycosylase AlkD|nr:DNA alkylation repair protein [Christensenellaceae bacterium]
MANEDFSAVQWNAENYAAFMTHLKTFADEKYRKFNMAVVNDNSVEHIGVRMPVLDNFVRQISKGDWRGFIKYNAHKTLEELLLHGKLIGKVKIDYGTLMQMLNDFLPYIKSWGVCDSTVGKFGQIKGNENSAIMQIAKWIKSDNPWANRVGLKILLSNFVTAEYIDTVLEFCKTADSDHYYVKMMVAWLVSECYIKFPFQTHKFLECKCLAPWTQNKAIQKIRESFRVAPDKKAELLKLKLK